MYRVSGKIWKRSRSRDNGQRTPLDLDDFLDVLVNGMGGLVVGVVGERGLDSRWGLDRTQILEVDVKAICETISHRPHLLAMMGDGFLAAIRTSWRITHVQSCIIVVIAAKLNRGPHSVSSAL